VELLSPSPDGLGAAAAHYASGASIHHGKFGKTLEKLSAAILPH
jgi:hypothetical protein